MNPRKRNKTDRRGEFVEQSLKYLSQSGVADFTLEELGRQLSTSKQLVKYYFRDKEDLLLQCFEKVAEIAQGITASIVSERHTWEERLSGLIDGAFAWVKKHPEHVSVIYLYYHYCCVNPKLANRQKEVREIGFHRISEILSQGLNLAVSDKQVQDCAFDVQTHLTGAIVEMTTRNDHKRRSYYHKRALEFAEMRIEVLKSKYGTASSR